MRHVAQGVVSSTSGRPHRLARRRGADGAVKNCSTCLLLHPSHSPHREAAAPHIRPGGAVVNVASIAGLWLALFPISTRRRHKAIGRRRPFRMLQPLSSSICARTAMATRWQE